MAPIIALIGIIGVFSLSDVSSKTEFENSNPVPIPRFLKTVTLGYNNAVASAYWLKLLQVEDPCISKGKASYNSGKGLDMALAEKMAPSRCHLSWTYDAVDLVTELSPHFMYAHQFGSIYLNIVIDDREGSRRIYERAVQRFPSQFRIFLGAAYLYLFEIQDPKRAAELLHQSYINGGPPWLARLAARVYSKSGQRELGISVLREFIEDNNSGEHADKAKERLEELLAE